MNQQITANDLFPLIGQQAVEIALLRQQVEQLQAMIRQAQSSATEAQEVAKKLHGQIQKSAMKNNGAELVGQVDYSTKS